MLLKSKVRTWNNSIQNIASAPIQIFIFIVQMKMSRMFFSLKFNFLNRAAFEPKIILLLSENVRLQHFHLGSSLNRNYHFLIDILLPAPSFYLVAKHENIDSFDCFAHTGWDSLIVSVCFDFVDSEFTLTLLWRSTVRCVFGCLH